MLPVSITSSPTTEAQALVQWKDSLLSSDYLESWNLEDIETLCTNWTGIYCNTAGTVSELDLSHQELNGTLTHFNFSSFPSLTYLDMSFNFISGNIPSSIGQLTELRTLVLRKNNLTSNIPRELGLCTKLAFLDLAINSFTGPLPLSFSNLTRISTLALNDNHLTGNIPY
ncbi:hypothetical protein AgCh_035019 [Apium graveolens]